MNRSTVTQLVRESAIRFGNSNPQQLKQLHERLRKIPPSEAVHGLLAVFTTCEPPPASSPIQELAGRLLIALEAVELEDVKSVIRAALPRYELSVEQFPQYLAKACGATSIYAALGELEAEHQSPAETRAIETMKFWLRGSVVAQNEA